MHRNSQKRIIFPEAVYFVTTKTKNNEPYFRDWRLAQLLVEKIQVAEAMKYFYLFAYVIIPDHLHLLIQPRDPYTISQSMFTVKKQFSHEANRLLGWNKERPITGNEGEQALVRLHRFVQQNRVPAAIRRHIRFAWQRSYYDHIIRNDQDLMNHIEYIRMNPVNHGLVKRPEEYPFLSIDEPLIERTFGFLCRRS